MIDWSARAPEEQRLLNPCFCASLIWHAAQGHTQAQGGSTGIVFAECFLALPMVLHSETRESLPSTITTSLPIWISRNPLAPSIIADRARALVPFTKEALRFGGAYGLLQFNEMSIRANPNWRKRIDSALKDSSNEVRECAKRAAFIGRWFAKTGSAETVFSLIGIQP